MRPPTLFTVTPVNPRPPLRAGEILRVSLEQTISDHTGHDAKGPHIAGSAELLADGRLRISITDTLAGRHAIAMLNDGLLDAVLAKDTVQLRVET